MRLVEYQLMLLLALTCFLGFQKMKFPEFFKNLQPVFVSLIGKGPASEKPLDIKTEIHSKFWKGWAFSPGWQIPSGTPCLTIGLSKCNSMISLPSSFSSFLSLFFMSFPSFLPFSQPLFLLLKDKGSIMAKRDKSTTHVEFTSSW
jgi:hypothetical protein